LHGKFDVGRNRPAPAAATPPQAGRIALDQLEQAVQGRAFERGAGSRSDAQGPGRRKFLQRLRPPQAQIGRQQNLGAVGKTDGAMP